MKTLKTLLKIGVLLSLFVSLSFGLEFGEIDSTMKQNINKTLEILQKNTAKNPKDSALSQAQAEQISQEIFTLFDSIFDYAFMAQLSLSKDFKKLNASQSAKYTKAFEKNLKKSFTDKLRLYKDEKMEVVGGEKPKPNRYNLKTTMILDGKQNSIIFKFYEKGGNWRVYDVDILGISVIATYRSQFSDILAHSSFETLLEKLQNEIKFEAKK